MNENINVEEIFGSKAFTVGKMRERLPKGAFKEVRNVMENGGELSLATADIVAKAMSESAAKTRFRAPCPTPRPSRPPEAMHIRALVC